MTAADHDPADPEEWTGPVADADAGPDVVTVGSRTRFDGRVWSVRSDDVAFGGHVITRDLMVHPGAVGVVALDADDRVLLIRQYRHPVGRFLFEPPAGLLDSAGEPPLATARRELVEEAGLLAARWDVLVDFCNSPGGTSETLRCYLARELSPAPGGRVRTGEAEEHHLPRAWVPLDDARDLVLAGVLGNPTTAIGVLAAWAARAAGWTTLRPVDAPWPARDRVLAVGNVFGAR